MHRGAELTKRSSTKPEAVRDAARSGDAPAMRQRPDVPPARDRRASYRVLDEQQSGQGSLSALSKLKMLERKRAAIRPAHDEPPSVPD